MRPAYACSLKRIATLMFFAPIFSGCSEYKNEEMISILESVIFIKYDIPPERYPENLKSKIIINGSRACIANLPNSGLYSYNSQLEICVNVNKCILTIDHKEVYNGEIKSTSHSERIKLSEIHFSQTKVEEMGVYAKKFGLGATPYREFPKTGYAMFTGAFHVSPVAAPAGTVLVSNEKFFCAKHFNKEETCQNSLLIPNGTNRSSQDEKRKRAAIENMLNVTKCIRNSSF